ncbi:MAG: hypothetical protein PWQ55_1121 [Chloroflexota bacterium]|nr:hypothetical protein [Chloroflexota bacterium]
MKKYLWIILLALLAASCSSAPKTYTDPFAYCAAVGTQDIPDASYTGPAVPDALIDGYLQAAGLTGSTEPRDVLRQTTTWRCMDGSVLVCNYGANLPCDAQANTDSIPSQAMNDYCAQNPGSDFIPMSVSGHETIYNWSCDGSTAVAGEAFTQPDAAGFLSNIWYALPAPAQN